MMDFFNNKFKIKHKLYLLALCVALPLILIAAGILLYLYSSAKNDLISNTEKVSFNISQQIDKIINDDQTYARLISLSPEIVNGTELGKTNLIIKSLTNFSKELGIPFVAVHDREGFSLGKGHKPAELFKNDTGVLYVQTALHAKKVQTIVASTDSMTALLSQFPVYSATNPESFVGMVTVGYYIDSGFAQLLKKESGVDIVICENNKILSSTLKIEDDIAGLISGINGDETSRLDISESSYQLKVINLLIDNKPTPLKIAVLVDTTAKMAVFQKTTVSALILLFISIFSSFLIALSFSKKIAMPISNLTEISQKLANGDYGVQVQIKSGDELEELGLAFEEMTKKLAQSFNALGNEITLKKTAEFELLKTKSYLSNIIQSMPSMLITIDENSIVTQWNQAAVESTGIPATSVIGKKITEITPAFNHYSQSFQQVINDRKPLYYYRQVFGENDDKLKNISMYPLIANGVRGLVLRVDDISELEKKEEQLRQMQKMETVGTLAGGLAHDFNNVLGGIIGTLSILKLKIKKTSAIDVEYLKEHLATMEESGQRAADMVTQLLTLSRKAELVMVPMDLNLAVKHVMKICQNTFDKCIELNVTSPPLSAMINGDPTQIEQVLLNLCVNASHAMTIMRRENDHQGGKLTIFIERILADKYFCSHHVEAEEGEYWKLLVSDTGIGMPAKIIAKIFEPFFTTKDKGKGTGLGLSMVYNILRQHRGFIDVYSEVNLGSCFNIYLPALIRVDNSDNQEKDKELQSGEGCILVIDDEQTMRKMAEIMLEECGYSILLAEDGAEGIEIYRKNQNTIDLVILDLVMPKMSGQETYEQLKQINPGVKVLLASGFRQDERVDKILASGIRGFIQKPYTIEKLAKAVSKTI